MDKDLISKTKFQEINFLYIKIKNEIFEIEKSNNFNKKYCKVEFSIFDEYSFDEILNKEIRIKISQNNSLIQVKKNSSISMQTCLFEDLHGRYFYHD